MFFSCLGAGFIGWARAVLQPSRGRRTADPGGARSAQPAQRGGRLGHSDLARSGSGGGGRRAGAFCRIAATVRAQGHCRWDRSPGRLLASSDRGAGGVVGGSGRRRFRAVIAVFQPHLFSRTRFFAAEFAEALGLADVAVSWMSMQPGGSDPAVTGRLISDKVPLPSDSVVFAPDAAAALDAVLSRAVPGDLVLTIVLVIDLLGPRLVQALGDRGRPGPSGAADSASAEPR